MRFERILSLAVLLLFAVSAYMHIISAHEGARDWLLLAARMWLGGKKLYVDIFEVNPPLIFWIYALPAYIALHLRFLEAQQILVLLGLGVAACSIFIAYELIGVHPQFAGSRKRRNAFALLLCFAFIVLIYPAYFFDRDHIFLLLTFPYIVRFMPSIAHASLPRHLRLLTGCLAGVGFCIKPHCLIVFAGVQLLYALRSRSFAILVSIENILIYSTGLVYVSLVCLTAPEYFSLVLPMAMETYSAFNRRLAGTEYLAGALFIFAITFVDFRLRYTSPYRKDIYYFIGICFCFLLYALTNNGWGYTYNPLLSIIYITTGLVLSEFLYLKREHAALGLPVKQFVQGIRACSFNFTLGSLCVISLFFLAMERTCDTQESCRQDTILLGEMRDNHVHSFGTITIDFLAWARLADNSGTDWETRFNALWMLPKFILSDAEFKARHQWILDYVGNALAEDLDHRKPELVFVNHDPEIDSEHLHINLLGYFSEYPNFSKAWKSYHYLHAVDICTSVDNAEHEDKHTGNCVYEVYRLEP